MHAETIVDFCRFLRDNGFNAGVLDTLAAVRVARTVENAEITVLQHALRASLCTSKEEWDAFDQLFESFLAGETVPKQRQKLAQPAVLSLIRNGAGAPSDCERDQNGKAVLGASIYERLTKTDLSDVAREDQAALERLAHKLFKRAATRLSRRLRMGGRRATLDLRRTIRRSIGHGGEIFGLRYKGKKPKKPRLFILLDISGSMNPYSLFLLRFAHALQSQFRQTHTFVFSTQLSEVTTELQSREIADALTKVSARALSWSGGTKIGESLERFNSLYARKLLSRDTLFIILSDGWDTGEPDRLASELRGIRQKVRKLIWLSPLVGLEEYRPVTRALAAALPYLDVFAPANSLESLALLDRQLCSTNS
jgi:uncharacterized protein with von Willebrand factor type A (vWA) domain